MADLGIFDIVALSKAGYKKKDIDAIIAGEKDKPLQPQGEADPTPDPIPSKDPEPQPQGEADPTPDPIPSKDPEPQPQGEADPTPDYKKLYETLQKEQEATKQQIKNLQAQINQQDRSGGAPAPYDPQSDLLASLSKFS